MCAAEDKRIVKKYVSLMHSAKARNIPFELPIQSIRNLLRAKRCYFTNELLTYENSSIDRIDNTKGYIKGNCVACIQHFNSKKRDLTPDDIRRLYIGVILRRKPN